MPPSLPQNFAIRLVGEQSLSLRFALVAILALALLIPLALVDGIAFERERYYQSVVADIAQGYAQAQAIVGPILVVPVVDRTMRQTRDGPIAQDRPTQHILLPKEHNAVVALDHDYRHRGIYEVPVYLAHLKLSGSFGRIERAVIEAEHHSVDWSRAFVTFGITDTRGIRMSDGLTFGAVTQTLQPGSGVSWLDSGIQVPLAAIPQEEARFQLSLTLAGTSHFALAPLGDQSHLQVRSTWPHPKFEGTYLPVNRRISETGFSADWTTTSLARGVPGSFSAEGTAFDFIHRVAAIQLFEPVTQYTVVDRGIKYGALFIALTYLTVLCFELFTGTRLHLVQYGVIGLALVLFYLVLLSLSEHLPFLLAYLAASAVITALLGWYALGITRRVRAGVAFATLQVGLYWVLYVLLQLLDYALLTGTSLLVVGLAALMAVTRSLALRPRTDTSTVCPEPPAPATP